MTATDSAPLHWQTPPTPIDEQYDSPRSPIVRISPNRQWFLELERPSLPDIRLIVAPILRLAGLELNPKTWEPARAQGYGKMTVCSLDPEAAADPKARRTVVLPDQAQIRNLRWSPQGHYLAFTLTEDTGVSLWVLELVTAQARKLTESCLNGTYGNPCNWISEEQGLLCKMIPANHPEPPAAPEIPIGPQVENHAGEASPSRTYTNLLTTAHDADLFAYYLTSVLMQVGLDGTQTPLTDPCLIDEATPSPDGQWILLETLSRPFSYQVPLWRFPHRAEVLDLKGQSQGIVADLPLNETVLPQYDAVRPGRRWVNWRGDRPATLFWVEALDQGDPRIEVPHRDAVYQISAPFGPELPEPQLLWKLEMRLYRLRWGRENLAIGMEAWYDSRQLRLWKLDPTQTGGDPQLLHQRDFQDAYQDPGELVTVPGPYGWGTLLFAPDTESVYLEGYGASPKGVYPFLDRWNLATDTKERLWQAEDPYYEAVRVILDPEANQFITARQSSTEPNNFYRHDRRHQTLTPLTQFRDPLPWYAGITRHVVRYLRADGLTLSATLYLPPGYDPSQGPLPTLLWVYPEEFRSRDSAGQVTTAENAFSRPWGGSILFLLTQGYAILDNPSIPILGEEGEEPNDTYGEQLLSSAHAAVDFLVERGIADPDRVAVGGHSYGAFTVANLLAHSDRFRAGIARSGAYNRTLTPFGFQGEQRTYWEALETYTAMSPFTVADRIKTPLLLIHGGADSNPGTYPIQSERLFEAIKGLGGTVRWVVLPGEGHDYRSRQAVGHVLWEMVSWLDRYLKG
ncbi:MAG: prolyl oligopeptidase family serine peptidase [Prochlorothrix sp.]|nr:prolyl oligopeptidase family serine peptidase [Prochlorothrix sp.]